MPKKLFVARLTEDLLSVDQLASLFRQFGTVIEAKINQDKRIGWITFSSVKEAENAVQSLHTGVRGGLVVQFSSVNEGTENSPKTKLFVRGLPDALPDDKKEQLLRQYFKTFGDIAEIQVLQRGSAFVRFYLLESAKQAVELTSRQQSLDKTFHLKVTFAESADERQNRKLKDQRKKLLQTKNSLESLLHSHLSTLDDSFTSLTQTLSEPTQRQESLKLPSIVSFQSLNEKNDKKDLSKEHTKKSTTSNSIADLIGAKPKKRKPTYLSSSKSYDSENTNEKKLKLSDGSTKTVQRFDPTTKNEKDDSDHPFEKVESSSNTISEADDNDTTLQSPQRKENTSIE
ncbi:uncharacterized protein MONOS_7193 [Monocercomonoides exilis]|uniref:uncharacterized protein n=1 Tax=Monocercomonoides exilis TaxID=2049356 RepID=UPI003559B735|nr:hypothetical protein MONOS_7193 [Monocercomonoides exilis]|eukprot:MONOS_7193.1-p1 / transcript=MONOS_7193.1 / gene=MONOS_7193 / organism=Monocercomonoides_exilis_PA203 / gene_product=unspecified product / transcript_product=unspecified product / location=Mono_scaffold00240:52163-53383(+) / protein_length=342 / sequence_SO=supercontig / SO=protein_coding / is_pseudo=false